MDCRLQVWPVAGVSSVSNAWDEQCGRTWPIIGVSAQDDLHTEDENEVCPGPSGPAGRRPYQDVLAPADSFASRARRALMPVSRSCRTLSVSLKARADADLVAVRVRKHGE